MEAIFEEEMPRARLAVLLKYFSQIEDGRDPWRVMYPLDEVLLLLTCATIASSLHGANITWIFCGGSRHFISGSHAPAGCGRWSIVSTRRCSGAASRVEHKADCLLALKGNQPTLEAEVADYFRSAPAEELVSKDAEIEKGHGRIEMRTYTASSRVDSIASDRSYPGEPRFTTIKTLIRVHSRTEYADRCSFDTRFYISSAALDIDRLASGVRGHWGVESMHWLLDVEFKDDLSRYRPVTAPRTWPSCAASLSASSAPTNARGASKHEENPQAGTQAISLNCFSSNER